MLDILNPNGFTFWVPFEIFKSKGSPKDGKRWIEGIASTDDIDLQREIVTQNGIDFSYFLKHGYFNNDHKPGFDNKIGEPTECKVTPKGLYVKGFLYKNKKTADDVWEMANSLDASSAKRKLGFSIQGKVLRRAGKTIVKCWVQDIAITAAPINTNTWLDVVKSLNSLPQDVWVDVEAEITPDMAHKAMKEAEGKCCGACNCSGGGRDQAKSMGSDPAEGKACPGSMSSAIDPAGMDLRKQKDEEDAKEKALSASGESGRVMRVESLEGRAIDLDHGRTDPEKTKKSLVPDELSFPESVAWLQAYRNLSQPDAQIVAKAVFHMNGLAS